MKIVKIRLKQLPHRKIKDTQKLYNFICPIDDVEVGDYVLVELRQKKVTTFGVGRVDEIEVLTMKEMVKLKPRPDQLVYTKINVDDFEKRCDTAMQIRRKVFTLYSQFDKRRKAKWKAFKKKKKEEAALMKQELEKTDEKSLGNFAK